MNATEYLRSFNGLLGLTVFVFYNARLLHAWHPFSHGQRLIFAGLWFYLLANIEGTFEIVILSSHPAPFSWRILLALSANLCVGAYLAEPSRLFTQRYGREAMDPAPPPQPYPLPSEQRVDSDPDA